MPTTTQITTETDTRTPEQRAADHDRGNALAVWDSTAPLLRPRYAAAHPLGLAIDRLEARRKATGEPPRRPVLAALDLLAETISDELTGEGDLLRGWRSHEAIAAAERAFLREAKPDRCECCDMLAEAADILSCARAHLEEAHGNTVEGAVIERLTVRMLDARYDCEAAKAEREVAS